MPQQKISAIFNAWVSGIPVVEDTVILVAVFGKQNWNKEIMPALKEAMSELMKTKVSRRSIVVAGLAAASSDPDKEHEENVEFFNRMHKEKKFIRILLSGNLRYKIFRNGQ
jgi:hypothetical protein